MSRPLILALDQGTTSSRAIVFDDQLQVVAVAQREFPQHYPEPGWVEHAPDDLWSSTLEVARSAIEQAEQTGDRVVAIGIANQRETTLVWRRDNGRPIGNAIVWQDRRTSAICDRMSRDGHAADVTTRTGLLLDPYFSATKVAWLLDDVDGARSAAARGELAFGTVDSYLIWRLTHGRSHVTDVTNASRTNLFNIQSADWDDDLLRLFNVPASLLPNVLPCTAEFGRTDPSVFGREIPILGVAGDQQAAAVGQGCFDPGDIKSTYGTGCFVLMNTGAEMLRSNHRLLTTIAWQIDGRLSYALEGSIFVAGAAVQWLRDGLGLVASAPDTERMAAMLDSNRGVYVVPAFTGLGAPHWDPDARGAIFGLTRDTGPNEIARATLESIAYQTHDLFAAMAADGVNPRQLAVDGGMVSNDWFVQFLADILNLPIQRPCVLETTAVGAAWLAGKQAGLLDAAGGHAEVASIDRSFQPQMDAAKRQALLRGWDDAVARCLTR